MICSPRTPKTPLTKSSAVAGRNASLNSAFAVALPATFTPLYDSLNSDSRSTSRSDSRATTTQ